ncbi:hypothetical protein KUH32_17055 [Thalassococcus sp. CAU 1522]|uniref:Uncharacterized protein n=1 Tax=Thalassococcus arenae TaxID=2851652 RepID=A0ABS6NBT8_9RHOB|nr:hypothetical protein [Thalassococcus arenae]MBV2361475.1 hypothetical protein [Thalassococcus arenae]
MCKNAETPCPGCKKHKKADAAWMFFTEHERRAIEESNASPTRFGFAFLAPEGLGRTGPQPATSNG